MVCWLVHLFHACPDAAGKWHRQNIEACQEAFPGHRAVGCRGSLSIDVDDKLYALLELQPLGEGWHEGKPTRDMNWRAEDKRLIWLTSEDRGRTWRASLALAEGTVFNQANVERPTGVHIPAAPHHPPFIFFDGMSRYPNENEIIQNNVYLVR